MSKRIIPFLYLTLSSIFIIVSTSTAGTIDLPQTGQTKCYNSAGGEIACIGTGQDGEIRAGVEWPNPRFADNGEGTITDRLTGLIWLKDGNCFGPQTWYNSLDNIVDFNTHPRNYSCQDYTAAYTDWRLPNINELESLLNPEQQFPSTWLNDQGFINIQYSWYWSSTTRAATVGLGPALHCAWTMSMMVGWISTGSGTYGNSSAYLLPVRAGQSGSTNPNFPANVWKTGQKTSYYPGDDGDIQAGVSWPSERFTDNGDGTVTDNLTGLMWTKNGSTPVVDTCPAGIMTWQDALDFVACLNAKKYLGYEDWRLPNRKEFFSLIDCSQVNPALPTGHPFVNLTTEPNSNYWASTSAGAYSNAVAWLAMIKNEGGIGGTWKNNQAGYNYQVWPVRGGLSNPAPGHLDHFSFPLSGTLENRTINLAFGADWPWGECGGLIKKHAGVDISAVKGESVYAANPGIVRAIVDGGTQWAKAVTIEHITSDPVFTTVYWHIDPAVTLGQTVINGQVIGHIADLGANTHLHFGVRMSAYSNISNRGALPQTDCGGDPAFPEHFVDPLEIDYAYVWTVPGHQLEYCDLPAKTPTAKNLVFITHGWKGSADEGTWVTYMADSIRDFIRDNGNPDEWDVMIYDWSKYASAETDSVMGFPVPFQAYVNAISIGEYIGRKLAAFNYDYDHIHFIAHSAGSALIDTASSWIKAIDKDSPPTIHCTFLDAYDPRGDLSPYGLNAIWAEQYVDTRPILPSLVNEFDTTDTYLQNCYNFNVTPLDLLGLDATYTERHAWPYKFYQDSIIKGPLSQNFPGFGFALSLESGNIGLTYLNQFLLPGETLVLYGENVYDNITRPLRNIVHILNDPFDLYSAWLNGLIRTSVSGAIDIVQSIPFQVTLTQGSPVWMRMQFEVIEPINILSLDYEFLSSSDGLLSVFFDNKVVSKIDERVAFEGTNEANSIWLGEVEPGTHVLSFRLDSFTGGQSVVKITNVRTGVMKVITLVPGDLNGDGDIDSTDYSLFRSTLGKCSGDAGFIAEADYDEDGCVTYADYRIWYGYYRNQQDLKT